MVDICTLRRRRGDGWDQINQGGFGTQLDQSQRFYPTLLMQAKDLRIKRQHRRLIATADYYVVEFNDAERRFHEYLVQRSSAERL
jgi:hypothetical protein